MLLGDLGVGHVLRRLMFQWAPTLGGECCFTMNIFFPQLKAALVFQWAPTLGGECYKMSNYQLVEQLYRLFQWAPTLGGECYRNSSSDAIATLGKVSMGTHPWG